MKGPKRTLTRERRFNFLDGFGAMGPISVAVRGCAPRKVKTSGLLKEFYESSGP